MYLLELMPQKESRLKEPVHDGMKAHMLLLIVGQCSIKVVVEGDKGTQNMGGFTTLASTKSETSGLEVGVEIHCLQVGAIKDLRAKSWLQDSWRWPSYCPLYALSIVNSAVGLPWTAPERKLLVRVTWLLQQGYTQKIIGVLKQGMCQGKIGVVNNGLALDQEQKAMIRVGIYPQQSLTHWSIWQFIEQGYTGWLAVRRWAGDQLGLCCEGTGWQSCQAVYALAALPDELKLNVRHLDVKFFVKCLVLFLWAPGPPPSSEPVFCSLQWLQMSLDPIYV
ncbi:hypothetical protein B0H16DRAFT_1470988 [Mycena metata]|uniref:Uncharacterized protein n=1 Tax=Mycena metata TaxID=1033252 RepID=A0AAD7MRA6_9AGAR|nr:hypothetical protein B0H16DRAFT_1470988 [Mycena metata]